jgi:hypothetical protein
MKKIIIAIVVITVIVLVGAGIVYAVGIKNIRQSFQTIKDRFISCEDSDGGKDYYKLGWARGFYNEQENKQSEGDRCTLNGSLVESCVLSDKKPGEVGCKVMEMYCENKELKYEIYECPNGCLNGECDDQKIIGGDKDEHGCIGSAGYSWCEAKQKCLRVWEEPCEANAGVSKCAVENCHGLDIKCGPNPPRACTMIYMVGDNCLRYARCGIQNGKCQQIENSQFTQCKLCVQKCIDNNVGVDLFDCEEKCN